MSFLLGVDAGTTSLKVGLYDRTGRELATAGAEYRLSTPEPAWVELDPELYWSALANAVHNVLAAAAASGRDVAAMAVSSQGETVLPVSRAGEALAPAIVWLDNRAVEEAREIGGLLDDATVYEATGIPTVVPTWPACKILWWKRHAPEIFEAASHFLLVEEYLLHRLTGRFVGEGGVQSTSLLYDIVHHDWWQPALEILGVTPCHFGELVLPGEVLGTLTASAAETLGLTTAVRVAAGGMDQSVGAVGVGNVAPGILSESTGGALTLQASIGRADDDRSRQTPVYVHSAPALYLYCPVCPTGGMTLTWFRDNFGEREMFCAAAAGMSAYDLLTELAAKVPPGSDGLTMLPHLSGAFSPEYEPTARGVFFGFTLGHGRGHFVRAILEAVAFMLRRNMELLEGIGAGAGEIRSHGGGAKSALWGQIKADVCSLPVVTLSGTEAAVRGDAMLAGVASGAFGDLGEACVAMVQPASRFEPDQATRAVYEVAYRRYIDLFETVRPLFC